MAQIDVGGTKVNWREESRCRVCVSTARHQVETGIAAGRSWRGIVRDLPQEAGISEDSVRRHWERHHMPARAAAVQRVADERMQEIAPVLEAQVVEVARHLRLAHAVVDRVTARLAAGEVEPDLKDGLVAVRLLASIEQVAGGGSETEYVRAFEALILAARSALPPEQFDQVNREFKRRTSGLAVNLAVGG